MDTKKLRQKILDLPSVANSSRKTLWMSLHPYCSNASKQRKNS